MNTLYSDFRIVRLDLSSVDVDIRGQKGAEFLEGFSLDGEMNFEHWLKEMRSGFADFSEETAIDYQSLIQNYRS